MPTVTVTKILFEIEHWHVHPADEYNFTGFTSLYHGSKMTYIEYDTKNRINLYFKQHETCMAGAPKNRKFIFAYFENSLVNTASELWDSSSASSGDT